MNSWEAPHLEETLLLAYLDGELPARKQRRVRRHAEACWQCRCQLEELQKTIAECVRYRRDVLATHLPEPPRPWADLSRDLARIDALLDRGSWWARPAIRWTALAATALALVWVIGTQLRQPASVEAASLLKRAIAADEVRPPAARRIRIRTRSQQLLRRVLARQANLEMPVEIVALFQSAHYDGSNPLSAKSYLAWHERLPQRQDEVKATEGRYEVRTTTGASELAAATLTLRATDLHPVEGRFEFRNQDWVEMTELSDQEASPAGTIARTDGLAPPVPGRGLQNPEATISTAAAGIADELQVVAALHQAGADLGDPVAVARDGAFVVVSGTGVSETRQRQIHDALAELPNVRVRLSEPGAAPVGTPPQGMGGAAPIPGPTPLQTRIEAQLGGRVQWESFSTQLLDRNDAAMTRAYALRRLAQQFPADAERELSPQNRETLRSLGLDHLGVLVRESVAVESIVSPLLASLGASETPSEASSAVTWQAAAEELFQTARRVETLSATLTGVSTDRVTRDLPTQLLTALAQLHADVQQCERLLKR